MAKEPHPKDEDMQPHQSPVVQTIQASLDAHQSAKALRISVAKEPKWENDPAGGQIFVRWMCWNLLDEQGRDITAPEFEVLSKEVTGERLMNELPAVLPGVVVVVDDDIQC